jgi:gas vesicle protein
MNRNTRLLAAFLGGVAAGAVVGLLFAPDSGSNTRDKLSYQLDKYLQKLNALLSRTEGITDKVSGKYPELTTLEDKKKAEELLREVESLLSQIQSQSITQ